MAKVSKASVNYRGARLLAARRCGNCSMFRAPGSCTLVAGPVRPRDVCDRWAPERKMMQCPAGGVHNWQETRPGSGVYHCTKCGAQSTGR